KITTLPKKGQLTLDGKKVTRNQEIPSSDITHLTYQPNTDWHGIDTLTWKGFDGTLYSKEAATITLDISVVDDSTGQGSKSDPPKKQKNDGSNGGKTASGADTQTSLPKNNTTSSIEKVTDDQSGDGGTLPETSTHTYNWLFAGLIFILMGLV